MKINEQTLRFLMRHLNEKVTITFAAGEDSISFEMDLRKADIPLPDFKDEFHMPTGEMEFQTADGEKLKLEIK